jgi:hypothetical protein
MSTILEKIKSIKLCLMAHPDYEYGSEFEYRISDLEEIENELSNKGWVKIEFGNIIPDADLWMVLGGEVVFVSKDDFIPVNHKYTHYQGMYKPDLPPS